MKTVVDYENLNVSDGSPMLTALLGATKTEATAQVIGLTGAGNLYNARQPGLLTQGMAAWFAKNIAASRVAAISEMKNAFEADSRDTGNAAGIYLENVCGSARQKTVNASIEKASAFSDKHKAEVVDHEQTLESYKSLRSKMGREPVRTKKWLYVLALLGIVLLEAFINFESFMKVPYITSPFLATGATMAVGLAVGFSAHFHGVVFRQWAFLFQPQESAESGVENRRNDALRRLAIGSVLLAIALLMVGGARYYYLREYIVEASILGVAAPSLFGGIIFMLLGNVVAYIVGLLISYVMHDPNPTFAEQDQKLRKTSERMEALKKQRALVHQDLAHGLSADIKAAVNQDASARGPRYGELRDWADRIVNKDQEIVGVLIEYRQALLQEMGLRTKGRIFRYPGGAHDMLLPISDHIMLTGDEYASLQIVLGHDI
jgi:putative flippase GtrA